MKVLSHFQCKCGNETFNLCIKKPKKAICIACGLIYLINKKEK